MARTHTDMCILTYIQLNEASSILQFKTMLHNPGDCPKQLFRFDYIPDTMLSYFGILKISLQQPYHNPLLCNKINAQRGWIT